MTNEVIDTAKGAKKSVMIWDTQSQEVVGNNVYDVKSPPAVGSSAPAGRTGWPASAWRGPCRESAFTAG